MKIPDSAIITRPPVVPSTPAPAPVPTPPVVVNVPQDQTVIAGWIGDLNAKVDIQNQRIDEAVMKVDQAYGQAAEIVRTTNGRLTMLETHLINLQESQKNLIPLIIGISLVVCVAVLVFRALLDKWDGKRDGVVNLKDLKKQILAKEDAE